MYFKPRIFISSLLREPDKISLRKKVAKLLGASGSEVILYEVNLTPAVNKLTYRKDILEADFVIFILDENKGTKTEQGLTGTEEEFIITEARNNPHIFI